MKSLRLILYLWGYAFSSRKQTLHAGAVKLGQGDNKAMVSAWLWCKNPSGYRHREVEETPGLMKDSGHAFAKHSEAFGAGQHWDPHVQLDLKGNPAANPESGLVVTRCAGGYSRE